MQYFENREDMIFHYLKEGTTGAELGVFKGDFSKILLQTNPSKLYLVDLFEGHMVSGDKDGLNMQTIDLQTSFDNLKEVYFSDSRVVLIKGKSVPFLNGLTDHSLDFVYIDADHSYEGVKQDIEMSFKKVKSGGYIFGHDYTPRFEGVVRAVNEFCKNTGLRIDGISRCGCPSFCIVVNK